MMRSFRGKPHYGKNDGNALTFRDMATGQTRYFMASELIRTETGKIFINPVAIGNFGKTPHHWVPVMLLSLGPLVTVSEDEVKLLQEKIPPASWTELKKN